MSTPPALQVGALLGQKSLSFLGLEVIAGRSGVERRSLSNPRIQKPGLALAGYLPYVKPGRLQILGESEFAYLDTLDSTDAEQRLKQLVDLDVPAIVATKGQRPPATVVSWCDERSVPFIVTPAMTSDAIKAISVFLEDELAPRVQLHGVLVDVFSLGTLIIGDPGIGKSECALELVYRGHRLVADDIVVIRRTHSQGLLGRAHELLENFLELRGVGIIDVRKHFGMTATSGAITISLVIQLVKLSQTAKQMEQRWRERLMEKPHEWTSTEEILGVSIPRYTMAVAPGRDVAIMVETAVRRCLLAERGIHDERTFLQKINKIADGDPTLRVEADDT